MERIKTATLSIILLLVPLKFFAQNLVMNPGFEEFYFLPDLKYYAGSIDRDTAFICKNWYRIPGTTPDYYNIEATDKYFNIPNGMFGFKPSVSGNAYLGLVPMNYNGAFEIISGKLIKQLEIGKRYEVSFKYSFGGDPSYWKLNKLEVFISGNIDKFKKHYQSALTDQMMTPEIKANVEIFDTLINDGVWHVLKGVYTAVGGERFISIGIFNQDIKFYKALNDYVTNFSPGLYHRISEEKFYKKHKYVFIKPNLNYKHLETVNMKLSYYFIDDVSVIELN